MVFFDPLPDDRFTLTIADTIVDPAGNALDGESNAVEPQEDPNLPTGDGQPGGGFAARFTVDTRPELAVYASGSVWVDTNGNFTWDPQNLDHTHRDITYVLGYATDDLIAGNFAGPGVDGVFGTADDRNPLHPDFAGSNAEADGFDKLGAYGRMGTNFRWLIDMDNDGVADPPTGIVEPAGLNGLPVAGNFDGIPENGDEVGLLVGTTWWFDTDHDYQLDATLTTPKLTGLPVVGDFDGNGVEDLAVWKDDSFTILFNPPAPAGQTVPGGMNYQFGFIGTREKPVAADMDRDGIDDLGLWVPDRSGATPEEIAEWYFLVSGHVPFSVRINNEAGVAQFSPEELFGKDMYAVLGDEFALPLVGNFDPPVAPADTVPVMLGATNLDNPYDVNGSSFVSALDVLLLVNEINETGPYAINAEMLGPPFVDVNGDRFFTAGDVLEVINHINLDLLQSQAGESEGEGASERDAVDSGNAPQRRGMLDATDPNRGIALQAEGPTVELDANRLPDPIVDENAAPSVTAPVVPLGERVDLFFSDPSEIDDVAVLDLLAGDRHIRSL